jgi:hypothetical protein
VLRGVHRIELDVYNPTIACLKSDPKLSNPNPIRVLINNSNPIRSKEIFNKINFSFKLKYKSRKYMSRS